MTQTAPQDRPPKAKQAPKSKQQEGDADKPFTRSKDSLREYAGLQSKVELANQSTYDLRREAWIPTTQEGRRVLISLEEALTRPEAYGPPEGDTPEETFGLLRLLEGLMLAALGRPDEQQARALLGGLSSEQRAQISRYLDTRDWNLFGPRPFLQMPLEMRADLPNELNPRHEDIEIMAAETNARMNTSAARLNPSRRGVTPAQAATQMLAFQMAPPVGIQGSFVYSASNSAQMGRWHVWHRGETLLMTLIPALMAATMRPGAQASWDEPQLTPDEAHAQIVARSIRFCGKKRKVAFAASKTGGPQPGEPTESPRDTLQALSWINRSVRLLPSLNDSGELEVHDVIFAPDHKTPPRGLGPLDPHLLEMPRTQALKAFAASKAKKPSKDDEEGEDPEITEFREAFQKKYAEMTKTGKGETLSPAQIMALETLSLNGNEKLINWSLRVPETIPQFSEVMQLLQRNSAGAELQAQNLESGPDGPRWERVLFGMSMSKAKFLQSLEVSLPYTGQLMRELAGVVELHHVTVSNITLLTQLAYGVLKRGPKGYAPQRGINPTAAKEEAAPHRSEHALQMLLNEAARQQGYGYGFSALPQSVEELDRRPEDLDPEDPELDFPLLVIPGWEEPTGAETREPSRTPAPTRAALNRQTADVLKRWRTEVLSLGTEHFNRTWELSASTPDLQRKVAQAHSDWRKQFIRRSATLIRPYLPTKETA